MDFSGAITVRYEKEPGPFQKLLLYLGHYDCRVYFGEKAYIDVGAGSLAYVHRIAVVPPDHIGSLGSIGRFCEVSETAQIMAGGEHDNSVPVNITFSAIPILAGDQPHQPTKPVRPVAIGSGVVIAAGAVVRSGAVVGDCAMIGANAVVSRDVTPFSIVAGAPARELSRRTPCQPWWNFATDYLLSNLADIQAMAVLEGGHRWRVDRPRFVIHKRGNDFHLSGFLDGEAIRPFSEAPASVRAYLLNALSPQGNPYWLADCWAA